MTDTDPAAVRVARDHIEAWSHQDWDAAQSALAEGVRVTVNTTQPVMGPVDTTGIEDYMVGLHAFADPVTAGSAQIHATTGDAHNALVFVSVEFRMPQGDKTDLHGARLYQIDDSGKIQSEKVIFYMDGV
jgi:SnoaL-like domain